MFHEIFSGKVYFVYYIILGLNWFNLNRSGAIKGGFHFWDIQTCLLAPLLLWLYFSLKGLNELSNVAGRLLFGWSKTSVQLFKVMILVRLTIFALVNIVSLGFLSSLKLIILRTLFRPLSTSNRLVWKEGYHDRQCQRLPASLWRHQRQSRNYQEHFLSFMGGLKEHD